MRFVVSVNFRDIIYLQLPMRDLRSYETRLINTQTVCVLLLNGF